MKKKQILTNGLSMAEDAQYPNPEASFVPIKQWSEDERPREKLMLQGKGALSNAELLALLIGSGTRSVSAVDLGKLILQEAAHDLSATG